MDDADSVATDDSEWLILEAEEGELVAEERLKTDSEDEDWNQTISAPLLSPMMEEGGAKNPEPKEAGPSAILLQADAFRLGHGCLAQCGDHGGDITACWAKALEGFPAVSSIFNLGRIVVSPEAAATGNSTLSVVAPAVVFNNGGVAWPEATTLRIVAGDPFGFDVLPCGGVWQGCAAELVLDLTVPVVPTSGWTGGRSAWVLTDGEGTPFGPLLVVEVVWA